MTYSPLDSEARELTQREQAAEKLRRERQERDDVQAVFGTPEGRRLLSAFLADAGLDTSAFRLDPVAMAHAATWQDAARWWLDKIRRWCPEREAQARKESREARPIVAQDVDA